MPDIKTETVSLAEATNTQLRTFATKVLGLEVGNFETDDQLRAKIAQAYSGDTIIVPVEDAEVAQKAIPIVAGRPDAAGDDEWITILISKQEGIEGDSPVWASVNGRGLWIERGKPQRIRRKYEHVLANAVATVYDLVGEGRDMHLVPREVPRYPYHIVSEAA